MRKILIAVALATGSVTAAQAAVFYEDFSGGTLPGVADNGYTTVNAGTPLKTATNTFTINATTGVGNVDIVGKDYNEGGASICGGQRCIDLDGTGAGLNSFMYSQDLNVQIGQQYQMDVVVGGNHRGGGNDNFIFGWLDTAGHDAQQYSFIKNLDPNSPFQTYSLLFTATAATLELFVQNATGDSKYGLYVGLPPPDNQGALLRSLSLTAVPLPAAGWLLLSGLAGVATFARRRRARPLAA